MAVLQPPTWEGQCTLRAAVVPEILLQIISEIEYQRCQKEMIDRCTVRVLFRDRSMEGPDFVLVPGDYQVTVLFLYIHAGNYMQWGGIQSKGEAMVD